MPKQKRWQLKRYLEQADKDLKRSQRNIIIVAAQFEGLHDDYYKALSSVVGGIEVTRATLLSIKDAI